MGSVLVRFGDQLTRGLVGLGANFLGVQLTRGPTDSVINCLDDQLKLSWGSIKIVLGINRLGIK